MVCNKAAYLKYMHFEKGEEENEYAMQRLRISIGSHFSLKKCRASISHYNSVNVYVLIFIGFLKWHHVFEFRDVPKYRAKN